ncbi:cytochrome ubiquinol oxidase subunit I [Bombilactobacillus thymidiniphilus]|uniref:Cytochrome ubiquinol oxidase subunit I n=1 Tax=Bombilactobacillus thymidiniphilus TaxID=2923363 RepID=A0ABY4PBG6_9LACO|nr:cytochrome ubiquinol oxidase subunit I [Bombilactobacillus thymidiniphilus]UQS82979.1 cytochrome ubiquinol oxidase subunit I [Bombilactobacillus thymidiniphilus]
MFSLGISVLSLARIQFAMTTIFHFFFVPFSIGMGFIVAVMETIYAIKKDEIYNKMARFWGKIFLLSFAVGIVTGLIQEFQFGMNWSNYSRFMGDIFGAPLAIEALLAFFLESTFVGVWMFTWDRFKPGIHAIFIWLTSIGTMLSAIWILTANSFMQHPTGFTINAKTHRVQMTSFSDIISNPQLWRVFPHLILGAFVLASFVIIGMSAWALIRKQKDTKFFKKSMYFSLWIGLVSSFGVVIAGDYQTQQIIQDQPMKFAATEGEYEDSGSPASWKIVASFDTKDHKVKHEISVPYMLSLLAYHKPEGGIKGMNTLNKELKQKFDHNKSKSIRDIKDYYLPTTTIFWSFRIMAGFGALFILVALVGIYFSRSKKFQIEKQRWFLYVLGLLMWAPIVANTCGWLITELGRYPWIVYGLYTIADAVSATTTAGELIFSNILYFLLFAILGGVMIYYCRQTMHKGLAAVEGPDATEQTAKTADPFSKEAFN